MNLKQQWPEDSFTRHELFLACNGDSSTIQHLPEGTEIEIEKFIVYDDEKENGDCAEVLRMIDTNGEHYSTVSASIKKMVIGYTDFMGPDLTGPFKIRTRKGSTKAGRTYFTCDIV